MTDETLKTTAKDYFPALIFINDPKMRQDYINRIVDAVAERIYMKKMTPTAEQLKEAFENYKRMAEENG